MNNNRPVIVWLILGVLVIVFAGGAIFYAQTKKMSSSQIPLGLPNQTQVPSGVKEAQKTAETYPKLVKQSFIQQQVEGILKAATEKSWTLEQDGQTLTLTNEGTGKIRYTTFDKPATSSAQIIIPREIKREDVKIGSLVSVSRTIDWQTGQSAVVGITVLPQK